MLLRNRLGEAESRRYEPGTHALLTEALRQDPVLSTTVLLAIGYERGLIPLTAWGAA